jgi:hypothetical protein
MRILLVLSLISTLTIGASAQSQMSPKEQMESLWINVPSSPLQFRAGPSGRGYEIGNWTIGHVVRYRLGCVADKDGTRKLLNKRPPVTMSLEPRTESEISIWGDVAMDGVARPEPCQKGRLAFIEVWFQDGGVWRSPQVASK